MPQRRPIIAGLAVAAMVTLAAMIGGTLTSNPPSESTASATATPPTIGGPVVFYEIDDADGAKLMTRTLDGRSLARLVAFRADLDSALTWSVDPTGNVAIAATTLAAGGTRLDGVSVATGQTAWSVNVPPSGVAEGVWSADGRRFATPTDPDDPERREVLVVDPTTGVFARTAIPDGATLQGFDPDGALIVRVRRPGRDGTTAGWGFLRVAPGTGLVEQVADLPDVGPASGWNEDVDPAAGIGFDLTADATDEAKMAVRMWSLAAGTSRVIATFPAVGRVAIEPTGRAVAASVQNAILLIGRDGQTAPVWSGPEPATTFDFSSRGDYLSVMTDESGPAMYVIERSSGRSIQLPLPAALAGAAFVRVLDGTALPEVALPAVEPSPTPTPAPSGPDVASSDGIFVAWIAPTNGEAILHVERRVPTADGGMRTVDAMATASLGPVGPLDDIGPAISLLPRPGSRDVLVWVLAPDGTHSWLWSDGGARRAVPVPPDWPTTTYDLAWRPDGQAIAATATIREAGEFKEVIVVAPLNGRKTTVVSLPADRPYDRLEGWWSNTELRLGHAICTEGCPGRHTWSARFRVSNHRLTELTVADRAHGPVDVIVPVDPSGLDLLLGNQMPESTIHIDWPAALGATGPDFVGYAADGKSLIVAAEPAEGTDLYRIDDPADRAIDGKLADPKPTLLGHLGRRGIEIHVSPDEAWALVTDRTGGIELVELATGRTWPIDRDTTTTWALPAS